MSLYKLKIVESVQLLENIRKKKTRTVILPVLYGCKTCSLTLRGEQDEGVTKQGAKQDIWT
jgi:hypothetical protein